jgi:hypothetical protein
VIFLKGSRMCELELLIDLDNCQLLD